MTTTDMDLITGWRARAAAGRQRANELGDGRPGLELFTEATVLGTCADQAASARDRIIAILRHRVCERVHQAHGELAKYRRQHAIAQAGEAARALEVVLSVLGDPGDRSLPQPAGSLPLPAGAETEAREYLGAQADCLLGRFPVL